MTGFETLFRTDRRAKLSAWTWVTAVCLILLALLAVNQVAHSHVLETDADHCPLCIAMQSAAPVAVAVAAVILVQVGAFEQAAEAHAVIRYWHPKLFTRPPPIGC